MARYSIHNIVLATGVAFFLLLYGGAFAQEADSAMSEIDTNEAEREAKEEAGDETADDAGEDAMAELVFGDPKACISTQRISRTEILNDREVLFHMYGSEIYLNRLPHRCSGLRRSDAFGYEVRTSQLCDVDVIRVMRNFGGSLDPGIACGLGKFLPVGEEQLPLLREKKPLEDDD